MLGLDHSRVCGGLLTGSFPVIVCTCREAMSCPSTLLPAKRLSPLIGILTA